MILNSRRRRHLNFQLSTLNFQLCSIAAARNDMKEEDRATMVVGLKADKKVKMGMITEVKKELRRAEAFKISYVSTEKPKEE